MTDIRNPEQSSNGAWHFREMGRGEMNQDPTSDDFFNVDVLTNANDALIRESVQNSLDAKIKECSEPVHVRIFLADGDLCLLPSEAREFLGGLHPHLEASATLLDPPEPDLPVAWLCIEDFGTRGLEGDPASPEDPKESERNDFYYFWRNVGRAKKSGSERGRWGLGKTMFPASSKAHSLFGLSITREGRSLLMGQSVLRIHHIDGTKHYPYGYFGLADPEDGFVEPIEDSDVIRRFREKFLLSRSRETGLSVVVPYPTDSINIEDIIRSVIQHYFYPILSGELEVSCEYLDLDLKITAENLPDCAKRYLGDEKESGFFGLLELARAYLADEDANHFSANEQVPIRAPQWSEELFSGSDIDEMSKLLDLEQIVVAKIPVHVVQKGQPPNLSHFKLIIRRNPDMERPLDVFVRQGITISGVKSLREGGIMAILLAEDDKLATFLGDAENPAHTEWQPRSRKFKGKYFPGPATLEFVKDAPRQFMRLLNQHAEHVDDTALRHIFPDKGPGEKTRSPGKPKDPTRTRVKVPSVTPRPRKIQIVHKSGGFSVGLTETGKGNLPIEIRIKCAYDVGRGNPFKKWTESDFDLSAWSGLQVSGGAVIDKAGNVVRVQATSGDFQLSVGGLDSNRDVIVEARTV